MTGSYWCWPAALGIVVACGASAAAQLDVEVLSVESQETGQGDEGPRIQQVVDAMALFKRSDADGALALLRTAVEEHPELPPARLLLAQWFSQAKRSSLALAQLELAVIEVPDDPEAYVILGDLDVQARRWTAAGLLYEKGRQVLDAFEGSAQRKRLLATRVEKGLAAVAEARRDWPTAQEHLEAVLAADPKDVAALEQHARTLFHQGKPGEALARLEEAKTINDIVVTPEAIIARWCQQTGDPKMANRWMIAALTKTPYDLKTRLVAAQWALETDQLEQAKQQADAALRIDADSSEALIIRGVVAMFSRDFLTAEAFFERVLSESPDHFTARNNLALVLCEQDSVEKKRRALEYANLSTGRNPTRAEAWSTLGWTSYKLGRADEAAAALEKAASLGTLGPDAAYYMASVFVDRGKNDQAELLLESALKSTSLFYFRDEAQALFDKLKPK